MKAALSPWNLPLSLPGHTLCSLYPTNPQPGKQKKCFFSSSADLVDLQLLLTPHLSPLTCHPSPFTPHPFPAHFINQR